MKPNDDEIKGKIDETAGKLKERIGRSRGDLDLEQEGPISATPERRKRISAPRAAKSARRSRTWGRRSTRSREMKSSQLAGRTWELRAKKL